MTAGGLILVVGPSGAGKDSLLRAAMAHFAGDARFVFPRRVVTRATHPDTEDHDSLSTDEFEAVHLRGGFALHWQAHGLSYGVPASVRGDMALGGMVIVNVSRAIIADAAKAFPRLAVIEVTAPPEILMARLAARGRGADGNISQRLARKPAPYPPGLNLLTIVNDETLQQAGQAFIRAIERLAQKISLPPSSSR
ncbi:MAG: phosphonate metabolism protein/1,5-bisphosphokinase (PRPP-forming) PhnN [Alphaproteobacteria bacterium]|nr:phosphonate metabolism protein/1,5-bisphosphokinase (PRPP-forming) PhnN [Alphaproteobacteria bacterium]